MKSLTTHITEAFVTEAIDVKSLDTDKLKTSKIKFDLSKYKAMQIGDYDITKIYGSFDSVNGDVTVSFANRKQSTYVHVSKKDGVVTDVRHNQDSLLWSSDVKKAIADSKSSNLIDLAIQIFSAWTGQSIQ